MEENGNNRTNCEECGDKRFEVIARAKAHLLEATNIASDEKEMAVIDNILFRCYQMGWLERYEEETKELNLKPFDIQKAKEGKPVCTRDGRKARIICFDLKNEDNTIVAAVGNDRFENLFCYTKNGKLTNGIESDKDLMMLPERREGWVNVYDADTTFKYAEGMVYNTKEEALAHAKSDCILIGAGKISWEE